MPRFFYTKREKVSVWELSDDSCSAKSEHILSENAVFRQEELNAEHAEDLACELGSKDSDQQDRRDPADHDAVQLFAVERACARLDLVCDDLGADGLVETFRALRFDPAFPKGANVNFYQLLGDGEIRILTFERGVEGYTRACGTGCGSVASVLWKKGLLPGGVLTAHNMGGTLKITVGGENENVTSLLLEGPTEITKIYDLDI